MKKIFSIILLCVCLQTISYSNFNDTDDHWAKHDIERLNVNGYINGYENGFFYPDEYIQLNEFLKLLVRICDSEIMNGTEKWDSTYIDYALKNELVDKTVDNFCIYVTRGNVANMLCNYFKMYNIENDTLNESYLVSIGILKGYDDDTLKLDKYITRAECAVLLNRVIDFKEQVVYAVENTTEIFKEESISCYTNYNDGKSIFKNTYCIKNGKVYYFDTGRYSIYDNVYIDRYNDKVVDILTMLISRENYVLNTYIEENDSIVVAYGTKDKYVNNGYMLFEIIFFDDIVNIKLYKLWKELYEVKNGMLNSHYLNKFSNILNLFLDPDDVTMILKAIKSNEINIDAPTYKYFNDSGVINIILNK